MAAEAENLLENDASQDEASAAKRGHVLTELLETERIYVTELCSILKARIAKTEMLYVDLIFVR